MFKKTRFRRVLSLVLVFVTFVCITPTFFKADAASYYFSSFSDLKSQTCLYGNYPAIYHICQAVENKNYKLIKRNGSQYIQFTNGSYQFCVKPSVFTANCGKGYYPLDSAINGAFTNLGSSTYDKEYQAFWHIQKFEFDNLRTKYYVEFAQLEHSIAKHSDNIELQTKLDSKCIFEFTIDTDLNSVILISKRTSYTMKFVPSYNLLAKPKNKGVSRNKFNYLTSCTPECVGVDGKNKNFSFTAIKSQYDLVKNIVKIASSPSFGTAVTLYQTFTNVTKEVSSKHYYYGKERFISAKGSTTEKMAKENLVYQVKQTAPATLYNKGDNYELKIECVPQLQFPEFIFRLNSGRK